jgi:hypothetical protein
MGKIHGKISSLRIKIGAKIFPRLFSPSKQCRKKMSKITISRKEKKNTLQYGKKSAEKFLS